MKKLFGTDGIRAVAGQSPLDPATVYAVGRALAHHLGASPRVLIGMDTRISSSWIAATLTAGLTQAGASVENAGEITTPAIAFLTRVHRFSAGIVISASHNPWQDNGIKLFGPDGSSCRMRPRSPLRRRSSANSRARLWAATDWFPRSLG
jgi:phosphoglucosamine mutase